MDYPILFFGVSLGYLYNRCDKKRISLPEEIMHEESLEDVDIEKLRKLTSKHGLNILVNTENGVLNSDLEIEEIYIGKSIRDDYCPNPDFSIGNINNGGAVGFDIEQVIELRKNPSELIKRLAEIGLDVKPEELALYGSTKID